MENNAVRFLGYWMLGSLKSVVLLVSGHLECIRWRAKNFGSGEVLLSLLVLRLAGHQDFELSMA